MATQYSLRMSIPFGTYKGVLMEDVIHDDPEYILWAMKNIEGFDVHYTVLEAVEARLNELKGNTVEETGDDECPF